MIVPRLLLSGVGMAEMGRNSTFDNRPTLMTLSSPGPGHAGTRPKCTRDRGPLSTRTRRLRERFLRRREVALATNDGTGCIAGKL